MSSISDALRRAQQERDRLKGGPAANQVTPTLPRAEPSLASVVLRKPAANDTKPNESTISATPLSTALRQAPTETPTVIRNEQRAAESIVEDYAAKRDLNLPAALVVYHDRAGPIAEQYRRIRENLMTSRLQAASGAARREGQALVVTSARAGEGKTVSLLNIGLSLVEVRSNRVLLIDGCLHGPTRGSLTHLLHLGPEKGLAELLAAPGAEDFSSYIRPTPWHNLHLLPSGAHTTPQSAAGLLQSSTLRSLLRHARANFDWVLIDAPPASATPDAGLLGTPADGCLLAVALHRTPHARVQQTLRRLRSMNLAVRSCILTRA